MTPIWSPVVSGWGYAPLMDMNPAKRERLVREISRATAEQLRAERAASGLIIKDVAKAASVSAQTVMRLESGERTPDVRQLAALCSVYGLSVTEFMVRVEQRIAQMHAAEEALGDAAGESV